MASSRVGARSFAAPARASGNFEGPPRLVVACPSPRFVGELAADSGVLRVRDPERLFRVPEDGRFVVLRDRRFRSTVGLCSQGRCPASRPPSRSAIGATLCRGSVRRRDPLCRVRVHAWYLRPPLRTNSEGHALSWPRSSTPRTSVVRCDAAFLPPPPGRDGARPSVGVAVGGTRFVGSVFVRRTSVRPCGRIRRATLCRGRVRRRHGPPLSGATRRFCPRPRTRRSASLRAGSRVPRTPLPDATERPSGVAVSWEGADLSLASGFASRVGLSVNSRCGSLPALPRRRDFSSPRGGAGDSCPRSGAPGSFRVRPAR
ncbi:MAG: hypothetical protein KatS3mg076_1533 [Candidatus Binatia bacterium]|nr:MAG: hypothetical protein KatS3mg076_1533 [Candidatus Binatia bacterium]